MKLNLIDIASCPGLLSDKLKSDIRINSINSNIKDEVISFLYNYGVNPKEINLENAFGIYLHESIIGLFSFENEHISTKFPIPVLDGENRHFSEIAHILIDQHLMDMIILQKCFSIIIPQLLNSIIVDEVIWCEYKGELWSKIINSFAKEIEYDFANESHYFAEKIINSNILEVEREKRLRENIKKAGF